MSEQIMINAVSRSELGLIEQEISEVKTWFQLSFMEMRKSS